MRFSCTSQRPRAKEAPFYGLSGNSGFAEESILNAVAVVVMHAFILSVDIARPLIAVFCPDNRFSAHQLIFCAYNRLFARLMGFHEKPTIALKDVISGENDFLKRSQPFTVCATRLATQGL